MYITKGWYRDVNTRFLFTHGSNYKMMSIITMDYPLGIPPVLRSFIEYLFILKETYLQNRICIWKQFCSD